MYFHIEYKIGVAKVILGTNKFDSREFWLFLKLYNFCTSCLVSGKDTYKVDP
jgi:hypothetical protein